MSDLEDSCKFELVDYSPSIGALIVKLSPKQLRHFCSIPKHDKDRILSASQSFACHRLHGGNRYPDPVLDYSRISERIIIFRGSSLAAEAFFRYYFYDRETLQ